MKRLFLLTAAVLLVASAAPPAASAGYWKKCGNQPQFGAGWYRVKAHGIPCGGARAVARQYTNRRFYGGEYPPAPYRFACQEFSAGIELARVACRRDLAGRVQKVRFVFGA